MEYHLLIITPAINRPNIHSISFPPIIKSIKQLKTKWLIHIDNITHLKDSVERTKLNIENMINDSNIDIDIITSNKPCFFNSVRLLLNKSQHYFNSQLKGILFLEDDWYINPQLHQLVFYNYINNINNNKIISLTHRDREKDILKHISFKPTIWGIEIYKTLFVSCFLNYNGKIIDPEKLLREEYSNHPNKYTNIEIENDLIFIDLGRQWIIDEKLEVCKWDKHTTTGCITYQKQYDILIMTTILYPHYIDSILDLFQQLQLLELEILWIIRIPLDIPKLIRTLTKQKPTNIRIIIDERKETNISTIINQLVNRVFTYINYIKKSIVYLDNRFILNKTLTLTNDIFTINYHQVKSLTNIDYPENCISNLYPSLWCIDLYKLSFHRFFTRKKVDIIAYQHQIINKLKKINPKIQITMDNLFILPL